jgi:molybdenum cofactor biosynthesis protein B
MGHAHAKREFVSLKAAVLTISDTRNEETDSSGRYLKEALEAEGHEVVDKRIVIDDKYKIRSVVSQWVADVEVQVIIITGGTGITGRDITPEAVTPLFDKTIDGFGEYFRYVSMSEIGTSTIQSRAIGGIANGRLIFCLPGSTGACKTAWTNILQSQLDQRTGPCNMAEMRIRFDS